MSGVPLAQRRTKGSQPPRPTKKAAKGERLPGEEAIIDDYNAAHETLAAQWEVRRSCPPYGRGGCFAVVCPTTRLRMVGMIFFWVGGGRAVGFVEYIKGIGGGGGGAVARVHRSASIRRIIIVGAFSVLDGEG